MGTRIDAYEFGRMTINGKTFSTECRPFRTQNVHDFLFPVVKTTGYKNVTPPGFVWMFITILRFVRLLYRLKTPPLHGFPLLRSTTMPLNSPQGEW